VSRGSVPVVLGVGSAFRVSSSRVGKVSVSGGEVCFRGRYLLFQAGCPAVALGRSFQARRRTPTSPRPSGWASSPCQLE